VLWSHVLASEGAEELSRESGREIEISLLLRRDGSEMYVCAYMETRVSAVPGEDRGSHWHHRLLSALKPMVPPHVILLPTEMSIVCIREV